MCTFASRTILLATFTLGFLAVSRLAPAQDTPQQKADLAEVTAYTFTGDSLSRLIAANNEIMTVAASDDDVKKTFADLNNVGDKNLASLTKITEDSEKIRAIAVSHGFDPHEFSVANIALVQAGSIVMMTKPGADRDKILATPGVNKANIELLEKHPEAGRCCRRKCHNRKAWQNATPGGHPCESL